jgi:hypothetical protein
MDMRDQLHASRFIPEEEDPVTLKKEREYFPGLVSMFWRREQSLTFAGIQPRFLGCEALNPISITTELFRVHSAYNICMDLL